VAEISADFILKTIIGHFLSDRDAYMTTQFPDINCCIPDIVMVSESGSSPYRGNFRLRLCPNLTGDGYIKRPQGPTAHLPNGELPLTCCRPLEGKPQIQTIGLIEGIGPKPFITAQLRSQIIIGAAGGNFAASPETLKSYLDTLSAELGTRQLTLYPDAGAISNSHVMRQYRRLKELVTRWGLSLRVAWWNQIDKNADLDADELLAAGRGEEIEEITWSQFEAIAHNPNRIYQQILNLFQKTKAFIQRRVVGFGQVTRQGLQTLQNSTAVNGHQPVQPNTPKPSSGTLSRISPGGGTPVG
jgi:hypothetical protein